MYVAGVVLLWGMVGTVEVVSLRTLTPLQFGAWVTIAGALGALVFLAARGRISSLLAYRPADHIRLFVIGLLGFAGYFFLKYTAYSTSPIPESSVLQATYMVFIVLFAIPLLGQTASVLKFAGVFVGFAGVALVITGGSFAAVEPAHLPGYLCALGAGVSFALFSVLCEKTAYDRMSSLFYYHAYSAAALSLYLVSRGEFVFPSSGSAISGILFTGPAANVFGVFLWLKAQSSTDDVSLLTSALYFVPFLCLLGFALFLDLPIPVHAILGLLLIILGLAIHTIRMRKNISAPDESAIE
jgi:drug/metabolite transporter (DMT)-like permease